MGPISLDLVTKERRKLSYACVCVDLGVDSHMLAEITVSLRGVDFIITLIYGWKPGICNVCRAFRHSSGKCPRNMESKVQ